MPEMSPWLRHFFNATAGLEKFIIAILAAVQIWIGAVGNVEWGLSAATVVFIQALIAAGQMLYATNTVPVPSGSSVMGALAEKQEQTAAEVIAAKYTPPVI